MLCLLNSDVTVKRGGMSKRASGSGVQEAALAVDATRDLDWRPDKDRRQRLRHHNMAANAVLHL